MKNINYKIRILIFLLLVFLLIVASSFLIYIFDPYQIFHKSYFYKDKAYDKTIYQDAGIINNYDFDSIIIGSSMLENVSSDEASKRIGGHFVNLSVSDSDFYERAIILRKALKKDIKNIIYSLDEHIYLYPRFGHPKRHYSTYAFLYDDSPYNDYKVYLNRDFIRLLLNPPKNSVKLPNPWITNKQTVVRFGGLENWIKNPAPSWDKDFILYKLPHAASKSINKSKLEKAIKLKNEKLDYLRNYVLFVAKRYPKTTFHFLFPPYYQFVHADERQNNQNKFLQYQSAIRFIVSKTKLKRHKNIRVYGFDDMLFTNDISNYTDLVHFKPEINLLMLDAIANKTHLLMPENVEDYLARSEKLAFDFDIVKLNNEAKAILNK